MKMVELETSVSNQKAAIKRRRAIFIALVLAAAGGGFWIWWSRRTPNLTAAALDALNCVKVRDAQCVYNFISEEEKQLGGWTVSSVHYVLNQILPKMQNSTDLVGEPTTQRLTFQGLASQEYKDKNGEAKHLTMDVFLLNGKPTIGIGGLMLSTMRLAYGDPREGIAENMIGGQIKGLAAHSNDLKNLGVKGVTRWHPESGTLKLTPFDQETGKLANHLAKLREIAGPGNSTDAAIITKPPPVNQ